MLQESMLDIRCYKRVCWISDVTRQYTGYQMLQESMLDIRCYKTIYWVSDVTSEYAG